MTPSTRGWEGRVCSSFPLLLYVSRQECCQTESVLALRVMQVSLTACDSPSGGVKVAFAVHVTYISQEF